jgi:outer membrane lipoprotein carrier protein
MRILLRSSAGRLTTGTCALLAAVFQPAAVPAQTADAAAVMAAAEAAYRALESYRADFRQTITNPMLGGPEHSRGVLFLDPPGRFAMRFTDPEGERIVADGKWLWLYAPSTTPGQVIRQPVPTSGATTPNFFAQFLERPMERYKVSVAGVDTVAGEVTDVVKLVPRTEEIPFIEAVIALARSDSLPRRLSLREQSGQERVIFLESPRANAAIPAAELRFTPPRGTQVVTP